MILIGCHGNRNVKFSKKIFKNLLLSHERDEAETLHKCCVNMLYIRGMKLKFLLKLKIKLCFLLLSRIICGASSEFVSLSIPL